MTAHSLIPKKRALIERPYKGSEEGKRIVPDYRSF
jgi:hypothetical protein